MKNIPLLLLIVAPSCHLVPACAAPTNLVWVGGYNTSGDAARVQVVGTYAYVADGDAGLQVIDVSNPRNPLWTGGCDTPGGALGIQVVGQTAYIADATNCLEIIDVSDPAHLRRLGGYNPTWYGGFAHSVQMVGTLAFVADGNLRIVDVSDPAHTTLLRNIDIMGNSWDVQVYGNYAWFAAGEPLLLSIYDIRDPVSPSYVAGVPNPAPMMATAVSVGGSYACVTDWNGGLYVIDVHDPSRPQQVGHYPISGMDITLGVDLAGDCAYVAHGGGGITVVDLTDPAHPVRATGYNTPGLANSVRVVGNYVFVADGPNGLVILEAQPLQRPRLSIALSDTNALMSWPATALGFVLESKSDLNSSNWFPVLATPRFTGEVFEVSEPMRGGEFLRLRRQ